MMKKIITILLTCTLLIGTQMIPIHASTKMQILVQIKNAKDLYLVSLQDKKVNVKSISMKSYLPIDGLDKAYPLQDINFSKDYESLITTIEKAFHQSIDYYVILDMKTLLKDLEIPKSTYDYETLHSLTNTGKAILKEIDIATVIQYQKYIETNLGIKELYNLYDFFKSKDFTLSYYFPHYYEYKDTYLLLDTHFYLKKASKK